MFKDIFSFRIFGNNLGTDLGTTNTLIYAQNKGIVLNMPSVLAVSQGDGKIVGIGKEAKEMVGKTPQNILAIKPLQDGVIADFDITEKMIKYFISQVQPHRVLIGPRLVVGIPSCATKVEKRAVMDMGMAAGARRVHLVAESVAAVIGIELPISEPSGSMIVDIGGGTSEATIASLNGIVVSDSIRVAGDEMTEAIIHYLKEKHALSIGEQMAEKVKIDIGCVYPPPEKEKMKIEGRDLSTGFPIEMEVNSEEVGEALSPVISVICKMIEGVLEKCPPDLAGDVRRKGIYLTGGGAYIKGLDKYLSQRVDLQVKVASNPLLSVALGVGKLLDDADLLSLVEVTPE
ncbi:MAG: rod shape-determining protein [Candidatus Aerophobetes bacterium]|nr:rod shape-determining protein [Candidatus Aerophobetes bacterium]